MLEHNFYHEQNNKLVFTGFESIDKSIGGFRPGELIIIGGRPAMGCTCFALDLLVNTSNRENYCYFDLGESQEKTRLKIESKKPEEWGVYEIDRANSRQMIILTQDEKKHVIYNLERSELLDLLETISEVNANQNIDCFIIDSLGLIGSNEWVLFQNPEGYNDGLRYLKLLALAINKPIIILAVPGRKVEKKNHLKGVKLPKEVALSYYGSRERIADWVLMLFRWSYYGLECDSYDETVGENNAELIIAKSARQVKEYRPRLKFNGRDYRFENAVKPD